MENSTINSTHGIPAWLDLVREKVESLHYGIVQLIVHDGRVTQIERTEKTRVPENLVTPRVLG